MVDSAGRPVLTGAGSARSASALRRGPQRVTRALSSRQDESSYDAVLAITDPQRTIRLRLRPDAEGVLALDARVQGGAPGEVQAVTMDFAGSSR